MDNSAPFTYQQSNVTSPNLSPLLYTEFQTRKRTVRSGDDGRKRHGIWGTNVDPKQPMLRAAEFKKLGKDNASKVAGYSSKRGDRPLIVHVLWSALEVDRQRLKQITSNSTKENFQ
jgi:hypothetical protein